MATDDTLPEIREIQLEIHRRMTPAERFDRWAELCDLTRDFARAGIRAAHPEWSEGEVVCELVRRALDPEPVPLELERQIRARNGRHGSVASLS